MAAFAVSFYFFWQSAHLPDLYRGRVCCDSREYIDQAERYDSYFALWTTSEARSSGYPLFLKLHRDVAKILEVMLDYGPRAIDFTQMSLYSALALYWISVVFLYRAFGPGGGRSRFVAFCLLISHPVVSGDAALPLSDGVCGAWMTFAVAFSLRACRIDREAVGRSEFLKNAAFTGLFSAFAALTRPSVVLPSIALITLVAVAFAWRERRRSVASIALMVAAFFLPISGPLIANLKKFDRATLSDPAVIDHQIRYALKVGLKGGQLSTTWNPEPRIHIFYDPISKETLYDQCKISTRATRDWLRCAITHPFAMLLHLSKQTIVLFDSFAINAYAVELSDSVSRWMNRAWGGLIFVLGMTGFAALLLGAKHVRDDLGIWIASAFSAVSIALAILVHIETRYTIPFLPAFVLAGGYAVDRILPNLPDSRRRGILFFMLAIACVFLFQVMLWEAAMSFSDSGA